jgi:hypothetical protein
MILLGTGDMSMASDCSLAGEAAMWSSSDVEAKECSRSEDRKSSTSCRTDPMDGWADTTRRLEVATLGARNFELNSGMASKSSSVGKSWSFKIRRRTGMTAKRKDALVSEMEKWIDHVVVLNLYSDS